MVEQVGFATPKGAKAKLSTFGLDNAGSESLSTKTFKNAANGGTTLGETMMGTASLLNAGTNIYGAFWGVKQGNEAIKLQKEQLDLAKQQYADEKARYEKRERESDESAAKTNAAGAEFGADIEKQYSNLPTNRF